MSALNLSCIFKTYNLYRYSHIISYCNITKNSFTTFPSCEESNTESYTSNSSILSNRDHDSFGDLRIPLEKSDANKSENIRLIRIKSKPSFKRTNSTNTFGNLSKESDLWYPDILEEAKIDNDQSDDSVLVRNISVKYRKANVYLERMKSLVKEKKLKEALDLFVEMKRNHVTPTHAHFTFMISACGKAGYTDMAFKLLRQMTDRKLKPTAATLTGLFNSCAETPFPDYGLRKAKSLREKIKVKAWQLTSITYHAMIKAFGKCGDIQTAFQIVDEMTANNIKIDVETYSFLLMSCVADKESGFTHAIEVWRKMKQRNYLPNEFSYNLLLRTVRDCDVGPEEISSLLLQHWTNFLKRPYGFKVKDIEAKNSILQISSAEEITNKNRNEKGQFSFNNEDVNNKKSEHNGDKSSEIYIENNTNSKLINESHLNNSVIVAVPTPSILGTRPENQTDVINVNLTKTPSDRLALVGGPEGILNDMKINHVKPSIKTFTLLLECLPPYLEAEEKLISLFDTFQVKPDIGFCNILMKRRIFRHESYAAKEVLLKINDWCLSPDIITFGVLASGCRHLDQALNYLQDLKKIGVCPNIEIAGALIRNACTVFDFKYLQHVLKLMEEDSIQPNERVLIKINNCLNTARKNIINMEHKKEVHGAFKRQDISKDFKEFCLFYESWLQKMKLEKEVDVWTQFKTEICEKYVEESC